MLVWRQPHSFCQLDKTADELRIVGERAKRMREHHWALSVARGAMRTSASSSIA